MANEEFVSAVKKLTENHLTVSDLIAVADRLKTAGEKDLILQLYKLWIQLNPSDPFLYAVQFNYGALLSEIGDLEGAKDSLERSIALKPDFLRAQINLGSVLERQGAIGDAIMQWSAVVNRLVDVTGANILYKSTALKQIGRVLESPFPPNAEQILWQGLDIDRHQPEVVQHYIALRLAQCEWPVVMPWESVDRKTLVKGIGSLSVAAYTDDPILHLASGWNYAKNVIGYPYADFHKNLWKTEEDRDKRRRRIGYVSSDLRSHAVGFVMAEMFEYHDKNDFEIFVYYCGPPGGHTGMGDPLLDRIKASVEHWVDLNGLDNNAAAKRIVEDGIDILVDINGYTRFARTEVFALQPAPIQVNWLGFPGSMGSPYHHYIIADDWIIPKSHEIFYSEKVLRLPCYQPNDRKRTVVAHRPTRQEAQLPENAVVFCCFNGTQKISRFTFERWMSVLKQVPDSVLWLLSHTEETNNRLLAFAKDCGVASERIIFAGKLSNAYHLARYPLADLFLDTMPYGAHVTASDALWMGVPILTLSGRGFASRVCGSLVRSVGLPELVCTTSDEYIERAVRLGNNKELLQQLRQRLADNKDTCVLFDAENLVSHLEELYRQMWKDFREDNLPHPDLTNMELYLDMASEEDHESVEMISDQDYKARYQKKLMQRHRYYPLPPDGRLWTAKDIAMEDKNEKGKESKLTTKLFRIVAS